MRKIERNEKRFHTSPVSLVSSSLTRRSSGYSETGTGERGDLKVKRRCLWGTQYETQNPIPWDRLMLNATDV